jgi:hypothetical protein
VKELKVSPAALAGGDSTKRVKELKRSVDRWSAEMQGALDATRRSNSQKGAEYCAPAEYRAAR